MESEISVLQTKVAASVLFNQTPPIATLRLNRPDKHNALTAEMISLLSAYLEQFKKESAIRAVILTAEGQEAFCAGTDIRELSDLDETQAQTLSQRGQELCDKLESFPVPVIAAINGLAIGGGCELALACHLRIAAQEATFSLPEVKLGAIPAYGGTQRLRREFGRSLAVEMILTGKRISADEARQVGLVNRVVDQTQLMNEAESLALEISELAPLAIRAGLKAVIRGADMTLEKGLELEAALFSELFATDDVREGTRAFLEKRKPVFKGT